MNFEQVGMSRDVVIRRLRPYLFTSYHKSQCFTSRSCRALSGSSASHESKSEGRDVSNDYQKRVKQLEAYSGTAKWYPRLDKTRTGLDDLHDKYYRNLSAGASRDSAVEVAGRVRSVRTAGSKLVFVDLELGEGCIQVVLQLNRIADHCHPGIRETVQSEDLKGEYDRVQDDEESLLSFPPSETIHEQDSDNLKAQFKRFSRTIRKGDWWQFNGYPHQTPSGQNSILALEIPELLSPSLHQIPAALEDAETRAKRRHVDMLVNQSLVQTMRTRHSVERSMREYFDKAAFTSVHTPILTASAGGAIARPFETEATELEGQKLQLRIAPELWLKRLVVGGLRKVYEMGPAFRNEGVDATHNPEFYICEFYEAFATLDDLMRRTEELLAHIHTNLRPEDLHTPKFERPSRRVEFIPTLEEKIGRSLPDLQSPSASEELLSLMAKNNLSIPSKPTLPRLLDALSSHYLETLCEQPTFITHHPICLSPLAKHFMCPKTNQLVSARAELFIGGREIANMYEEENSPSVQRAKFVEQLKYREVDGEGDAAAIDENYLEALEWGLPPTGGWGCGIDRLVMLFSGRTRIGDVLSFGTLRNVVGAGKGRR